MTYFVADKSYKFIITNYYRGSYLIDKEVIYNSPADDNFFRQ
jgi:hypothetical protein